MGIPEFWMLVRRPARRQTRNLPRQLGSVETEEDRATYLPTGIALAVTWNPALARRFGEVLGAGRDIVART